MAKYIKLEDALKYVQSKIRAYDPADDFSQAYNLEDEILLGINSLPSIDPQEMIREMIEEGEKNYDDFVRSNSRDEYTYGVLKGELGSLIKALSRITNK